jgi:hypothetical protein
MWRRIRVARESVEDAAEHESQGVGGGFDRPSRAQKLGMTDIVVRHLIGISRVQIDRRAESLDAPDR